MKSAIFIIYMISISCSSCMSFKSLSNINRPVHTDQDRLKAYVINVEDFKSEYKILKYSKKYDIVEDSTNADVNIELKKMMLNPIRCVTPQVTVLLFTLGFYPVRYLEGYIFEYDEIRGRKKETIKKDVVIEKSVSWFHLFSFKKNRKKAIGKSI